MWVSQLITEASREQSPKENVQPPCHPSPWVALETEQGSNSLSLQEPGQVRACASVSLSANGGSNSAHLTGPPPRGQLKVSHSAEAGT